MTRSTARELVKRRLQERTADGWQGDVIDAMVLEALLQIQTYVIEIDPFAFLKIAYVNTVAGTAGEFYAVPDGMWYEFEVGYKATSSSEYKRLERGEYAELRELSSSDGARYALRGPYFAIWPNPSAAVTAGLRVQYMPTLSIGDDSVLSDSVVLPIHRALHMAVVVMAVMMCLGETMEDKTPLATELAMYLNRMPSWYHRGGQPAQIRLSLNRDA